MESQNQVARKNSGYIKSLKSEIKALTSKVEALEREKSMISEMLNSTQTVLVRTQDTLDRTEARLESAKQMQYIESKVADSYSLSIKSDREAESLKPLFIFDTSESYRRCESLYVQRMGFPLADTYKRLILDGLFEPARMEKLIEKTRSVAVFIEKQDSFALDKIKIYATKYGKKFTNHAVMRVA